jgi:hypothetical protein
MNQLNDLKPQPDDMVVVPEDIELEEPVGGFPFHVYRMKFLHKPSIIRSGGYSMSFLDSIANTSLAQFFGIKPKESMKSIREEIFNHDEYGQTLRGDSTYSMGTPATIPTDSVEAVEPKIVMGFMGDVKAHGGLPELKVPQPTVKEAVEMKVETFFRHVRPNETLQTLSGPKEVVSPKGGVSFYIELDAANKTFAFSYALCNNNDNFDYERARLICKGRFEHDIWYEVQNYDGQMSIVENIGIAIHNFLYNSDSTVEGLPSFSSTPEKDKVSIKDLKEIYKRI